MQINLPDDSDGLILQRAAAAGFPGEVDAYVAHLIAADGADAPSALSIVGKTVEQIDALITAGIESGPARPMSDEDWRQLHARIDQRGAPIAAVALRPAAVNDLDQIAAYIQQGNVDAAHRFLVAAHRAFQLLATQPQMGTSFPHPDYPELRVWTVGGHFRNYAVFYQPSQNGVEVVRVLHGMRDLPEVLGE